MSDFVFLFDLDATITREEILPVIAKHIPEIDMAERMRTLTEKTMAGEIPFEESFRKRVGILAQVPVSRVRDIISTVPLNTELVEFIKENRECCYVVTGNIDVWIEDLMREIGMEGHVYCSHAKVENDHLAGFTQIIDKGKVIKSIKKPFVAVGDGNNDAEMIGAATIGIGFGGVRPIAPAVLQNATHAAYSEEKLCQFLRRLL